MSEIFQLAPFIEQIYAANLADGFDRLRNAAPDAMVLDIKFPDGNGLDLLRYAKQHFPAVTVVVNTNIISYRKHCMALGADYFFDKSLQISQLADTIIACRDSISRRHSDDPRT